MMLEQETKFKRRRSLPKNWQSCLSHDARNGLSELFGRSCVAQSQSSSFLRDGFFTLRLEHREGGMMARYPGEERLLLFRSDKPGAIAKIIFSSKEHENAKIHVLDVKADYRGWDLGGFLFTEAIHALAERYLYLDEEIISCQLDAEEDIRRHDRLLKFYQQLGCQVKPNAKIQYINNNDGETYRKIPMSIPLEHHGVPRSSILGFRFLPIQLREAKGNKLGVRERPDACDRPLEWLLLEDTAGRIQIRSTTGTFLRINQDCCDATNQEDESCYFFLHRFSDEGSDDSDPHAQGLRRNELWMLRQSMDGHFLKMDGKFLTCSKAPSFWHVDVAAMSLTSTTDTPLRRNHYRQHWIKQTFTYVQQMHQRYHNFELASMDLRQALDLMHDIPSRCFSVNTLVPSMRTLCFQTAEAARKDGQPDWVQLVALIHELGCIVSLIDANTITDLHDDYDWTISSRSRVVGCPAPDCASFSEFRYLNVEECEFDTPQGIYDLHCGLEKAHLAWTGPEYLFHMLNHNNAYIPYEGLCMLRYFSLGDWHTHNEYSHLANERDEQVKPFVADFDALRRSVRQECNVDTSRDECDRLWNEHYEQIACKYGVSKTLKF